MDLFVENYELLKTWALKFTERNNELAEDFTLNKPDLDRIQNLEGYLYIVMRNLHLSQLRRASRTPSRSLTVAVTGFLCTWCVFILNRSKLGVTSSKFTNIKLIGGVPTHDFISFTTTCAETYQGDTSVGFRRRFPFGEY